MVQNLTKSQLKDITNVMFYTRMKHKNMFLKNTFVIWYTLCGLIIFLALMIQFYTSARLLASLFGGLSLVCLVLLAYIFICRFIEKNNCKRLVREKGTGPCTVNFRKECIVYDGSAVNYKHFHEVYLYRRIYYLVEDNDVIVIQKCYECEKALNKHHIKIIEKDKPFELL